MQRTTAVALCIIPALLALAIFAGCGGHSAQAPGTPVVGPEGAFVGAEVCEACHKSQYANWTGTAHADALATVLGRPDHCLGCHTVAYGQDGGYVSETDTPHLANVQCENCHGAGGDHVTNPSQNGMVSPLEADVCAACHTGFHHPTADQWAVSAHAKALETIQNLPYGRDSCLECHAAEAIVLAGRVDVVLADVQIKAENAITCVACHDPHGGPNPGQLREAPADLCLTCHTSGGALPGNTPHHPQREILLGLGGFEANGAPAIGPNSAHSTTVLSRCVKCHVFMEHPVDVTIEDPVNTGHTFLPKVPEACEECHPGGGGTAKLIAAEAELHALLDQIHPYFDDTDPMYIDPATLGAADAASYDVADFNTHLVEADASQGVHNLEYTKHLLEVALGVLQSL